MMQIIPRCSRLHWRKQSRGVIAEMDIWPMYRLIVREPCVELVGRDHGPMLVGVRQPCRSHPGEIVVRSLGTSLFLLSLGLTGIDAVSQLLTGHLATLAGFPQGHLGIGPKRGRLSPPADLIGSMGRRYKPS